MLYLLFCVCLFSFRFVSGWIFLFFFFSLIYYVVCYKLILHVHVSFQSLERGTYGDVRKATWQGKIVAVKMFSCAEKNGAFSEEVGSLALLHSIFLLNCFSLPPSFPLSHTSSHQLVSLSMLHEHDNIVTLHGAHLGNTINDRVRHSCIYM